MEVRCDDDVSRGQDWENNAGALVPASSMAVIVLRCAVFVAGLADNPETAQFKGRA